MDRSLSRFSVPCEAFSGFSNMAYSTVNYLCCRIWRPLTDKPHSLLKRDLRENPFKHHVTPSSFTAAAADDAAAVAVGFLWFTENNLGD